MIKRIQILLLLAIIPFSSMFAFDCEVNGIYYNRLTVDEFEVTSGPNKYSGAIEIPEYVTYRDKQFRVTNIGANVFTDSKALTSLLIPQSITNLSDYAFSGCTNLATITIPSSITSIGAYAFRDCKALTSIIIPEGITTISSHLFDGCEKLTSVSIPREITAIGECAFQNCKSLSEFTIPHRIKTIEKSTFQGCTSLASAILPDSIISIGENSFYQCSSLSVVSIPIGITTISNNAFSECKKKKKKIVSDMNAWCKIAFATAESNPLYYAQHLYSDENTEIKSLYLDRSVSKISDYAFLKAENLSNIYLLRTTPPTIGPETFGNTCYTWTDLMVPEGSKEKYQEANYWKNFKIIGEHSYKYDTIYCDGLRYYRASSDRVEVIDNAASPYSGDIKIPETISYFGKNYNVSAIGDSAFKDCNQLTSVSIPNSVTRIGNSAFQNCLNLNSVHISDIAAWCKIVFFNSSSYPYTSSSNPLVFAKHLYVGEEEIKDLIIPSSVTSIGDYAFIGCKGLTSATIPNSVTHIGNYAFMGCSELTSIKLPEVITAISSSVFENCSSLNTITIPESVTSIGYRSFFGCASLSSITLPKNITHLSYHAFGLCDKLKTVVSLNETPPTNAQDAFDVSNLDNADYPGAYLLVPKGSKEKYQNYNTNEPIYKRWGQSAFNRILEFEPEKGEFLVLRSYSGGIIIYEGQEISDSASVYAVEKGKNISMTIVPNEGYELSACTIDGDTITDLTRDSENTFSYTLIADKGHRVNVSFSKIVGEGDIVHSSLLQYKLLPNNEAEVVYRYNGIDAGRYTLSSVTIPDSIVLPATYLHPAKEYKVTSIEEGTFRGNPDLRTLVIGNNIKSIDANSFYGCNQLSSVVIGEKVKSIGKGAFQNCSALSSIQISKNVKLIDDYAFSYCTSLSSLTLPDSLTTIDYGAFYGCSNLTSICIPNKVAYIGTEAFSYCENLSSIVVEDSNAIYDSRNNCNAIIETATNTLIQGCNSSIISTEVQYISECAFRGLSNITTLTIPNSVISIGKQAFYGCSSLRTLTIGEKVNNIGNNAFRNCNDIESITSLNVTPPTLQSRVFPKYTATLYVPIGSKLRYQEAEGWKNFTNIVEIEVPSGIEGILVDIKIHESIYDLNGTRLSKPHKGINIIRGKKVVVK